MKIIFGSLQAARKFVRINGKIIKGLSDNRKLLTYLPQHNFLPNHIKVRRIIDIFCTKSNAALIAKHNLIEPMLENKYRELAGGEKRILEIFLIVFSDSKYCLIDEPFNGIAPIHKEDIKNIIKEQSIFKGFILTDRDYRSILDISTRIVIMRDVKQKK